MNNPMKVLMLGVVMLALTSVPAPVDHTDGRVDGVATELAPSTPIAASVTVDRTRGFGVVIAELVFTEPVAAQEWSCDTSPNCRCWCQVLDDNRGEGCEERNEPGDPNPLIWSGPYKSCEAKESTNPLEDCGLPLPETCYVCEFATGFCDEGNGGGSLAAVLSPLPSGVSVVEAGAALVLGLDGALRTRCGGWVVGMASASMRVERVLI